MPSRRPSRTKIAVASAAAVASGIALSATIAESPAGAAPGHHLHIVRTLSDDFVGPLQFAVGTHGVYVADSFTSTLWRIGRSTPIATGPNPAKGGDIAGVAVNNRLHALAYTTSNGDHSATYLVVRRPGHRPLRVNLAKFEKNHNPDGRRTYGVKGTPSKCVKNALNAADVPIKYTGQIDSHPYAVTALLHGAWAVADAGGNDLLRVSHKGHVSVLAVLPRVPWVISQDFVDQNHLPNCVVGLTYYVEGVPTDVERGPGGLYATSLPGGEAAGLGRVYYINTRWHFTLKIGSGFDQATNLAVRANGAIYVTELGKGRISRLVNGRPKPVFEAPGVVGVEKGRGHLYASIAPALTGGKAPGSIVRLGY